MPPSRFQQPCPHCHADLTLKAAQLGKKSTCPECQQRFVPGRPPSRATTPGRPGPLKSHGKRPAAGAGKGWLIAGGVAGALALAAAVLAAIFWPRGTPAAPAPAAVAAAPAAAGLAPTPAGLAPADPVSLAAANTPTPAGDRPVPWIDTRSDASGSYYLVCNGPLLFQLYTTGPMSGKMTSLKFQGQEVLDGEKKGYAELNGSFVDPGAQKPTPVAFAFGENTSFSYRKGPDFIDVAMQHAAAADNPLDVGFHFVVRKEEPGLHTYAVLRHEAARPAVSVRRARLVLHTDEKLFRYASVEDDRWGYQPTSAELARGARVNADTTDMRGVQSEYTRPYHSKFQWAACAKDHAADGLVGPRHDAGSNHGIWCVWTDRNRESLHGGPTRWRPTVEGNALLCEYASSHQEGGVALECTGDYQKTYGPFYVHLNKGNDLKSLREDARRQGEPAVHEEFYDQLAAPGDAPRSVRATVTGRVRLAGGATMEGAVAVLSTFDPRAKQPSDNEFQRQGKGFTYWTRPTPDGRFTLKRVRPGLYRLTVYKPGCYDEFHHDNVRVGKGAAVKVPECTWKPDANGKLLWQVGVFDRSAAEFKRGDEPSNWYAAFDFNKDFPGAAPGDASHPRGSVLYAVDPNNVANDARQWRNNWNYIQWRRFRYEKPDPNDPGKRVEDADAMKATQPAGTEPDWVVQFRLDRPPAANATCTLSVGLVGAHGVKNLTARVGSHTLTFPLRREDESAALLHGVPGRAVYQKRTFPGAWLRQGTNTVVFQPDGGELMYDAVRLEVRDASGPPFALKVSPGRLRLKGGDRGALAVVATRHGYEGPITVELHNLPGHVRSARATIPAGQNQAALQVTADAKAPRAERSDVFALGTATAAGNQQVRSGAVTVSVRAKTAAAKPPKPGPVKKPKTPPEKKPPKP